ncbi:MAG: GatB/YqeY domain-containing protein [Candidatus Staskawiczbacteria bacterium]|nr:GatB/YqeY domain-containing protein [Candidatus Staskawiczbacteria bacterium]
MEIKQQIQNDVKGFIKGGNNLAAGALRMTLAAITSREKEKRYKISLGRSPTGEAKEKPNLTEEDLIKASDLTDEETMGVLLSEIKKRKDAIVLYEKGNRPELAEKEKKEIEVLQKYLPEQIPAEELKKIIEDSVNKVEAKGVRDIGKVMADLMPKVKGRADGSEISKIIKELLSK